MCHSKNTKLSYHGSWPLLQIAIEYLVLGFFFIFQTIVETRFDEIQFIRYDPILRRSSSLVKFRYRARGEEQEIARYTTRSTR